jgi:hypothetical protein
VIVAVVAVGIVQMAGHEVISVIAMRDRLVSAAGPMLVALFVTFAGVIGSAASGV